MATGERGGQGSRTARVTIEVLIRGRLCAMVSDHARGSPPPGSAERGVVSYSCAAAMSGGEGFVAMFDRAALPGCGTGRDRGDHRGEVEIAPAGLGGLVEPVACGCRDGEVLARPVGDSVD